MEPRPFLELHEPTTDDGSPCTTIQLTSDPRPDDSVHDSAVPWHFEQAIASGRWNCPHVSHRLIMSSPRAVPSKNSTESSSRMHVDHRSGTAFGCVPRMSEP